MDSGWGWGRIRGQRAYVHQAKERNGIARRALPGIETTMSQKKKKKREQQRGRPPKRGRPSKVKVPRLGALGDSIIVQAPAGERKMSEVILEFLEPYLGDWKTED